MSETPSFQLPEPTTETVVSGRVPAFPKSSRIPTKEAPRVYSVTSERPTPPAYIDPSSHRFWHNFALWNGIRFEVVPMALFKAPPFWVSWSVSLQLYHPHNPIDEIQKAERPAELVMHLYYPIDPRIKVIDIEGATRAYPNDENNGWLFAHTDEGTHHDYELRLLSAIDGVCQPFFRQLQVDSFSAASTARTTAQRRFGLLSEFYGRVVVLARKAAREIYLGEREQQAHPREGWLDRDITAAIEAARAEWTGTRDNDLTELSSAIGYLTRSLAMPSVETRWDREARLKAEAAAAAAASQGDNEGDGD